MRESAAAAVKRKRKRAKQPVYLVCMKLVNPDTGELVSAMVPANGVDLAILRERQAKVGKEFRAELSEPRDYGFHKLGHKICGLLKNSIDEFAGLGNHEILKKIQLASGVCCTPMEVDLGSLGKHHIKVPDSIAFDSMEEPEFQGLVKAIYEYTRENYWPDLTPDEMDRMVEMYDPTQH